MFAVPKPYPKEVRNDVVNVARNREPGTHLKQIAAEAGPGWTSGDPGCVRRTGVPGDATYEVFM